MMDKNGKFLWARNINSQSSANINAVFDCTLGPLPDKFIYIVAKRTDSGKDYATYMKLSYEGDIVWQFFVGTGST